jgi:hypothetical protein
MRQNSINIPKKLGFGKSPPLLPVTISTIVIGPEIARTQGGNPQSRTGSAGKEAPYPPLAEFGDEGALSGVSDEDSHPSSLQFA